MGQLQAGDEIAGPLRVVDQVRKGPRDQGLGRAGVAVVAGALAGVDGENAGAGGVQAAADALVQRGLVGPGALQNVDVAQGDQQQLQVGAALQGRRAAGLGQLVVEPFAEHEHLDRAPAGDQLQQPAQGRAQGRPRLAEHHEGRAEGHFRVVQVTPGEVLEERVVHLGS